MGAAASKRCTCCATARRVRCTWAAPRWSARTFVWTVLVLVGLCCRADNAGVTSFVRVLNFSGKAYHRFLHLFHSTSLDLDLLTSCWVRLCLVLFRPFEVNSRLVCLADGIKAPKEGRRMPGVKLLHQSSASNTKPAYIMGHSLQAVSLLVHSGFSVPVFAPDLAKIMHKYRRHDPPPDTERMAA